MREKLLKERSSEESRAQENPEMKPAAAERKRYHDDSKMKRASEMHPYDDNTVPKLPAKRERCHENPEYRVGNVCVVYVFVGVSV